MFIVTAPSGRAPAERDVSPPQSHSAPLEPELTIGLVSYKHLVPPGPKHVPVTHYYPTPSNALNLTMRALAPIISCLKNAAGGRR
jgi:hypothetical protein